MTRPTASVYIDGLNLYRRLLQGFPGDKWLDVEALAQQLLPEYEIVRVKYYTAIIKAAPGKDSSSPQRQQIYLRALGTLPRTTVHLGKFRVDKRVMILHPTELDAAGRPQTVTVEKMEEKGSDVALASHLLLDAFRGDSDLYAVLSNDSELVTPLQMVRNELGRHTGLLTPVEPKRASNELKQTAPILHRAVDIATVKRCQLPEMVTDEVGIVTRPPKWS